MTDALLHHGSIRVRSAVGEGTWFLVLLPRDPDQGEVADAELPVILLLKRRMTCVLPVGLVWPPAKSHSDYHEVRRDTMMGEATMRRVTRTIAAAGAAIACCITMTACSSPFGFAD